jgi:RNA polymerase sigma-B factor
MRETMPQARDELVRRHLPLARGLAARYLNSKEPFDDVYQVACVGLVKAVNRFDLGLGRPFHVYATPTILGEVKRHFRDTGWSVHVPRGAHELALRVQRAVEDLTNRQGRSPSVPELASYLELGAEEVLEGLEAAQAHFASSLDAPTVSSDGEAEASTLLDRFGDLDVGYEEADVRTTLSRAMQALPDDERRALVLRLQYDLLQSEIGKVLGCSQMSVSRLLRRAADRLRIELDPE